MPEERTLPAPGHHLLLDRPFRQHTDTPRLTDELHFPAVLHVQQRPLGTDDHNDDQRTEHQDAQFTLEPESQPAGARLGQPPPSDGDGQHQHADGREVRFPACGCGPQ